MSLTEWLVSILITAIIISGMYFMFDLALRQNQSQNRLFRKMDQSRSLIQFMVNDIQKSGYLGCRSGISSIPLRKNYYFARPGLGTGSEEKRNYLRFDRAVFGFTAKPGACFGLLPKELCLKIKENSDVLIVYNVPQTPCKLRVRPENREKFLEVDQPQSFLTESMVLISDCKNSDVFVVSEIQKNEIYHEKSGFLNWTPALSKIYPEGSEIMELQTLVYYLGAPERNQQVSLKQRDEKTKYGLFRCNLLHKTDEIIAGFKDLKLEFASRKIGDQNWAYSKAEAVQDWSRVCKVRIEIITDDNVSLKNEISIRNGYCAHVGTDRSRYNILDLNAGSRIGT